MESRLSIWLLIFIVTITSLVVFVILISRAYLSRMINKEKKIGKLQVKHKEELLANSILSQEEERTRIAENLHDNLTSKLNIAKLQIHHMNRDEETADLLQYIGECIQLSREIAHELKSPVLDKFGLLDALRDFVHPLNTSALEVYVNELHIARERMSEKTELHVFRIFQELVTNVIKHARASKLVVDIHHSNSWFGLRVQDDGRGYDTLKIQSGMGLSNIESRVALVKGSYRISSFPGRGTTTLIALKL